MSDPHAKRYFTALKLFLVEQLKLMKRWNLHGATVNGKDIVFITLPPDKDKGMFLKNPRKQQRKKRGKK